MMETKDWRVVNIHDMNCTEFICRLFHFIPPPPSPPPLSTFTSKWMAHQTQLNSMQFNLIFEWIRSPCIWWNICIGIDIYTYRIFQARMSSISWNVTKSRLLLLLFSRYFYYMWMMAPKYYIILFSLLLFLPHTHSEWGFKWC